MITLNVILNRGIIELHIRAGESYILFLFIVIEPYILVILYPYNILINILIMQI